jgi:hypothetical protein
MAAKMAKPFKNRTICPVFERLRQNGRQNGQTIQKPDLFVRFSIG